MYSPWGLDFCGYYYWTSFAPTAVPRYILRFTREQRTWPITVICIPTNHDNSQLMIPSYIGIYSALITLAASLADEHEIFYSDLRLGIASIIARL